MMVRQSVTWLLWDTAFLIILTSLSLFLISPYFQAHYLIIGYPDWFVHAFRVQFLELFGFASWSHNWGNGLNIWQSYQFIPHLITLFVAKTVSVDIPRAMVLTTIGLFILLRISTYSVLRALHFSPITAFACAVLTFDIASYWGGVRDYSIVFGFTIFPLVVYGWVQYGKGRIQLLFPYLIGLLFYIHPMVAISSIALWGTGVIFSTRKVISFTTLLHLLIMAGSSSLFWVPILIKLSYSHSSSGLATKYFLSMVLSGFEFWGLSLYVLVGFLFAVLSLFLRIPKKFSWIKVFIVFTGLYFFLMMLALNIELPKFISQFQFTRAMTIVGIAMIISLAPVIERVMHHRNSALKFVAVFFISLAFVDGVWIASIHSSPYTSQFTDMVSDYAIQHAKFDIYENRIFTATIGESSYATLSDSRFANSYNYHLESNLTSSRVAQLFSNEAQFDNLPIESIERLEDYAKLTGVKYVFLDDTYGIKRFDALRKFTLTGSFAMKEYTYQVFMYPGEVRDAALIDTSYITKLSHFPFEIDTENTTDQLKLDTYVKQFVKTIYNEKNTTLSVWYPSPTTVNIAVPANRTSNLVYLNESYDIGWRAYFNNREQRITPTGPNFMLISLDSMNKKGTLVLKHSWPVSFFISLFFIVLIPLEILLLAVWRTMFRPEKKRSFEIAKL